MSQSTISSAQGSTHSLLHFFDCDWKLYVTRNMSLWHDFLMAEGWHSNNVVFDIPSLDIMFVVRDGIHTSAFMQPYQMERMDKALYTIFTNTKKRALLGKRYVVFGKKVLTTLARCTKNPTVKNFDAFTSAYQRYTMGLQITTSYGPYGTQLLKDRLTELGYTPEAMQDAIAITTYPKEHTPLFESQLAMLTIGAHIQTKKVSVAAQKKLLEKWITQFGNIPVNYCDEPWTVRDAEEQLTSVLAQNCVQALKQAKKNHTKRIRDARALLKKINDSEVTRLAQSLADATYFNEYRKNIFSTASLRFRPLFAYVAKKAGSAKWSDCFYLTPYEMRDVLVGKKVSLPTIIASRKKVGIRFDGKNKAILMDATITDTLFAHLESHHGSKQSTQNDAVVTDVAVKGFGANKGIVSGVARVVFSSKDFHKVFAGDILVAPMTSVDFVPVMSKAAGFITNEGGITSHAAIVAREMNKPCIVGTKNATSVIRDGDIVEINGAKGTATITRRSISSTQ